MIGTSRICIVVLAGSLLLPLAGCSRTSDGTVLIKKPPSISAFLPKEPLLPLRARRKRHQAEQEQVVATQFPPAPEHKTAPKKRRKPAAALPATKADLSCLSQNPPGSRVRVVCK